ncbi:conserved Apicomplexan protein [Plasmodium brasilianum]|uniref:Conserved Apicomplexan protein n=1 Tax=Plasmodium brasilianum TaxID=5824 RepID=A0ACB9Y9L9_PLABR|nr:conserved Apicomplexan protein [Plasmodium brasilianum]
MNWKKALSLAGGAAAVVALTYILMKDDENHDENDDENDERKRKDGKLNKDSNKIIKGDSMTRDDLLQLLNEMLKLQTDMKNIVKDLIVVAKKNNYDFMAVYEVAKTYNTIDPLGKYQIEMPEFDKVVESYHFDPVEYLSRNNFSTIILEVKEKVAKLMSSQENYYVNMSDTTLSVDKIIEIHHFMLNELYKIDPEFKKIPNKSELDPKLIALVIQSIVSAKVEEEFNLTSEDVEASIANQQYALTSNMEFARVNIQMQTIMNKFMGDHFKFMCDKEGAY